MYVDEVNTKTTSQTWSAKIAVTHFTPPLLHTCVHTVVVPLVLLVMCSHWSDEVHHVWQKPANSFCVSWYRLLFTQYCPDLLHSIIQSTASGCFLTEFRLPCVLLFTYQKFSKGNFVWMRIFLLWNQLWLITMNTELEVLPFHTILRCHNHNLLVDFKDFYPQEASIRWKISRVWHSWKFWYEWMYEYIRINKITQMNIRIYSY